MLLISRSRQTPKNGWQTSSACSTRQRTWRFTKKGDRRPHCDVAKSVASKKRIKAERRQAATDRTLAAARKQNLCRALPGQSIADRMLQAMRPGAWYGMGDIARMAGIHKSGRGKVHQVLCGGDGSKKRRTRPFAAS